MLTQLNDDAMSKCGLGATQFPLLQTLYNRGPMRITALAAGMLLNVEALHPQVEPVR